MPQLRLTRRYRFAASHRLHTPLLTDEANRATYGKCNNPYGHGHDYVLDVTIAAEVDPRIGRALAIEQLDQFVNRVIVAPLNRQDLNNCVEEFAAAVPTTENLARVVAARLATAWPVAFPSSEVRIEKVRIQETRRNIFEVSLGEAAANAPAATRAREKAIL